MSSAGLPAGVGPASARWLFSTHFLSERLRDWPEFAALDTTVLHAGVERLRPVLDELATVERDADEHVYALYELPGAHARTGRFGVRALME